jgi:ATP-binding cassette subfamily A (ABC1) protein 3
VDDSVGMLTGDESMDDGNAYASGFNFTANRRRFLQNIGYCPQFDGFVEVLTGQEMLELFARLRGVKLVKKESLELLTRVGKTRI